MAIKNTSAVYMKNKNRPSAISTEMLAMLACPVCHGGLVSESNEIRCTQCQRRYPVEDGIPVLLADRAQLPG
jgi:uncharacterized protein YbaR (Trm112 family)